MTAALPDLAIPPELIFDDLLTELGPFHEPVDTDYVLLVSQAVLALARPMTAEEHTFDPPLPTPGTVYCGGQHYARARHERDGTITWVCSDTVLEDGSIVAGCGKERVTRDGPDWR